MRWPAFLGPSYTARSGQVERTINLYLEKNEGADGRFPWALLSVPGLSTFATAPTASGRAAFAQDGRCFAVVGFGFYEVEADGTLTLRGSLENDGRPATISGSGDAGGQLFITSGGKGYTFDLATNTLTTVLVSGAHVGGYLDGYFLSLDVDTSTLRISDYLDGLTWDPTQVALRASAGDKWVGMQVVHDEIWLGGSQTSEIWRNYGTQSPAYPFVFAPVPGAVIEEGVAAAFSYARVDSTPIWLNASEQGRGKVLRGNGYGVPARISNHAVEDAIQSYATIDDAVATSLQFEGHSFYILTFPTADHTWVYDQTSGQWVEWLYWDVATAEYKAYRPMFHALAFGLHLMLDRATGTVYELSSSVYTDAGGAPLRRLRRAPFPSVDDTRVFLSEFALVPGEVGVGLSSGQGSDPQVMLRISRDSGKTWGNEHWTTLGAIGAYLARVVWTRLGAFRGRRGVFEVVVTDPVPFSIVGAEYEAVGGSN